MKKRVALHKDKAVLIACETVEQKGERIKDTRKWKRSERKEKERREGKRVKKKRKMKRRKAKRGANFD